MKVRLESEIRALRRELRQQEQIITWLLKTLERLQRFSPANSAQQKGDEC